MSECTHCGAEARWEWFNGKGSGPTKYCDECARQRLDDDLPAYKDPITTAENVTTLDSGTAIIPGGGVVPVGKSLPVIRSKGAFDAYLEDQQ